jgi:acyl carrier protein
VNREEIVETIKSNMRMIIAGVGDKDILDSNSMRDFGADSLEMVEVVSRSMKQLKIKVPRAKLLNVQNLNELVDVFMESAAATKQPMESVAAVKQTEA